MGWPCIHQAWLALSREELLSWLLLLPWEVIGVLGNGCYPFLFIRFTSLSWQWLRRWRGKMSGIGSSVQRFLLLEEAWFSPAPVQHGGRLVFLASSLGGRRGLTWTHSADRSREAISILFPSPGFNRFSPLFRETGCFPSSSNLTKTILFRFFLGHLAFLFGLFGLSYEVRPSFPSCLCQESPWLLCSGRLLGYSLTIFVKASLAFSH